jgi:hypothetical protein
VKDTVPPETGSSPRPLAEILLEHGFVTQEQLDEAADVQDRTGKPLGQVLVEAGSLTRLELASALAEQWSNTETFLGPPRPEDAPPPVLSTLPASQRPASPAPPSDGKLDARLQTVESALQTLRDRENTDVLRLQESVLEISRRVAAVEPALEELDRRAQETVTSGQLDEQVAQLGPRLDGFQSALAVGEARLDQLANAFDAAVARQDEANVAVTEALQALTGRVEATTGSLAELAARPAADPGVGARLDDLAARLGTLADAAELAQLRAAVTEVAARPAGDPAASARLDELAARVDELAARPAGDPQLAAAVAELSGKVDGLADIEALTELRITLEELASRPTSDAELFTQLAQLAARVDALPGPTLVDDLERRLEELARRHASDPDLAARVDGLAATVEGLADSEALTGLRAALDELAARPAGDAELAAQVAALAARVDALDGPAPLEDALRRLDELAGRLDAVAGKDEVEVLRRTLAELASRPAVDPTLGAQLAELAGRVDAHAASDHDLAAVDELAARLAAVEQAAPAPADTGPLERRVSELGATVAQLAADLQEAVAASESLAQRLERAPAAAPSNGSGPHVPAAGGADADVLDQEVERLRMAIERMGLRLGEHDRALVELMQASARQASAPPPLPAAPAPGTAAELSPGEAGDLHAQLHALAARLAHVEEAATKDREKAFTEIERVASSLVWRLQRLETRESAPA